MIEVTKTHTHVMVNVKLKKRIMAKDKKIYFYTHDAFLEAKKKFPDLDIKKIADKQHVISNMSSPYEATWNFPLEKQEKKELPKSEHKEEKKREEKKHLKFEEKKDSLEQIVEEKKENSEQE